MRADVVLCVDDDLLPRSFAGRCGSLPELRSYVGTSTSLNCGLIANLVSVCAWRRSVRRSLRPHRHSLSKNSAISSPDTERSARAASTVAVKASLQSNQVLTGYSLPFGLVPVDGFISLKEEVEAAPRHSPAIRTDSAFIPVPHSAQPKSRALISPDFRYAYEAVPRQRTYPFRRNRTPLPVQRVRSHWPLLSGRCHSPRPQRKHSQDPLP
jgi:hypothetical protein